MVKSGPLGNAEKYYLDREIKNTPIEDMMKFLDRSKGVVEEYSKAFKESHPDVLSVASNIAHNDRGSTVMTQAAAEMISAVGSRKGPRPDCVTQIKK